MYIVYNPKTKVVYTIANEKPIAWTEGNEMAEVEPIVVEEKQYTVDDFTVVVPEEDNVEITEDINAEEVLEEKQ